MTNEDTRFYAALRWLVWLEGNAEFSKEQRLCVLDNAASRAETLNGTHIWNFPDESTLRMDKPSIDRLI